ncbi:unnamed protein product [Ixodes hexagonus]
MGIYVVISLDSQPACADLYFPVGLPAGSLVELCLAAPSASKDTKDDPRFALSYAYVNGRKVPIARNNYDPNYGQSNLCRSIQVRAPRVNGQRICQLKNLRLPVPSLAVPPEAPSTPENLPSQTDQDSSDAVSNDAPTTSADGLPEVEVVLAEGSQACAKAIDDIVRASEPETQTVFLCAQCPHRTLDKEEALSHCKSHLKDPRPTAAAASAKSAGVSIRPRHTCAVCGKKFVSNQRLQAHLLRHVAFCAMPSSAETVEKENDNGVRSGDEEADAPFRCLRCSKTYPTKASLDSHVAQCHSESPQDPDTGSLESHILISKVPGEKSALQCSNCGEQFTSFDAFSMHLQLQACAAGERDLSLSITTTKRKRREFVCGHCDYVALSYAKLCEHSVEHSEVTLFRCDMCGKVFLHSAMLEQHALVHSQPGTTLQRLYPCCYCDRVFRSHRGIEAHTNFHKNLRPFECRECGASLSSKGNLKAHMVSIHGDPGDDAKCPHCPKVFKLQRSLNVHLRAIHGPEEVHECQLCGKRLATERKLLKHQALVHFNDNMSAAASLAFGEGGRKSCLRPLTCSQCPYRTYSYPRLARHR